MRKVSGVVCVFKVLSEYWPNWKITECMFLVGSDARVECSLDPKC